MLILTVLDNSVHHWPDRLIVVIESTHCLLTLRWLLIDDSRTDVLCLILHLLNRLLHTLLHYGSLGKVCHCGALGHVLFVALEVSPIVACLLKMFNTFLQRLFLIHEPLDFLERVFASVLFQCLESLSKVFVFILNLKDLSVLIIDELRLLLNSLAETQIALKHFLHHVYGVNDSTSDGIFGLVSSVVVDATTNHSVGSADSVRVYHTDLFLLLSGDRVAQLSIGTLVIVRCQCSIFLRYC